LVGWVLTLASLLGTSVAVGVATLKRRLYEIDVVINRTLVYVALTGTLVLVYSVGVRATQASPPRVSRKVAHTA
jgi:two-component system NarL family sensor kinase